MSATHELEVVILPQGTLGGQGPASTSALRCWGVLPIRASVLP